MSLQMQQIHGGGGVGGNLGAQEEDQDFNELAKSNQSCTDTNKGKFLIATLILIVFEAAANVVYLLNKSYYQTPEGLKEI